MDLQNTGKTIRKVLAAYSAGNVRHISRIKEGFANINFDVVTDDGRYLVRFNKKQSRSGLEKEVILMNVLREHRFPAAFPLADSDGRYLHDTDAGVVMVYPFIQGEHPVPGKRVIVRVAETLARLHMIPTGKIPPKTNSIQPERCFRLVRNYPAGPCLDNRMKALWLNSFDRTASFLHRDLPTGLIHGDLFPDNILFYGETLAAVLDFEEFALDTFLFDIGMTINGFCIAGNLPDRKKIELFLTTYEKTRPLTGEEKVCLDAFIAWTALGMACWHINDCPNKEKPEQPHRIRELTERAHAWLQTTTL